MVISECENGFNRYTGLVLGDTWRTVATSNSFRQVARWLFDYWWNVQERSQSVESVEDGNP
jgi:hypothetical protein